MVEDKNRGERKVTQRLHRAGVHVKRCSSPVLLVLLIVKLLNCHFLGLKLHLNAITLHICSTPSKSPGEKICFGCLGQA